jgi:hypothetical protein
MSRGTRRWHDGRQEEAPEKASPPRPTAADAGTEGSRTTVRSVGAPPPRTGSVTIDDEAGAARASVDYLVARELV